MATVALHVVDSFDLRAGKAVYGCGWCKALERQSPIAKTLELPAGLALGDDPVTEPACAFLSYECRAS